jgi:dTDP-4-dehydrorhamnose reductase
MKYLITGGSGQVGSATTQRLSENSSHEVLSVSHSQLDIASRDAVFTLVSDFQPDVVINAAAMTNVDACETEVEQAFAINALGVRHLTQAAELINAHLVHISTDFVFDGEQSRPYTEFDLTNPLSVYAKSKLGGDDEALQYGRASVLRVAWVFGNPEGDFLSWVANGVRAGEINALIDDQVSTPTYAGDVARVIEYITLQRLFGLINVANAGETTRLDMGKAICERLGIPHSLAGIEASVLNRPAPRPNYSALSTDLLKRETGIEMRPWIDTLDDYCKNAKGLT